MVLEVTPLRVKAFEIGSAVDAIQGPPDKPYTVSAVILFRIERTLRGEFTVVHGATPSLFEQISDSVDEHSASSIVKLLTMNFERPGDPVQKGWVTVAVEDPEKTFGIGDWENPGDGRFRLSLNRAPQSADSYILADAQKI